ncbi:hypothetical protein PV325_011428 [Microctonus aethiopoides]|uniref:Deltamethrin resistance protein prag01 domain-containing protein n=1 Tax=Microctonus aethiopoides TaxID=144406 RepID=A0AA39EZL6_9HYME|nr:hypothetical protein PV326_011595 [Microctonus aethiopoides]KAK0081881.1 hypothetical protein PV325_011428 [Microctonus aethiopoides]KAK0160109.1 hypothetical protein PV328_007550 [Microctonus aethiopoides]
MLNRVVRPITRIAQRGVRRYHEDKSFKYASMDELPVPSGSWQAQYDAYQKKYNMQLIAGVTFFIATFIFAKASGSLYLNAYPPEPKTKQE